MTDRHDPYNADRPLLMHCHCGARRTEAEHAAATLRARSETAEFEAESRNFIEASLVKALFPQETLRR